MKALKPFVLSAVFLILAQPAAGLRQAQASPFAVLGIGLGAEIAHLGFFFLADREIARNDQTNLKLMHTALDGDSNWRYKVYDGDEKNTARSFQSESDALAYFNARVAQKTTK